MAAWSTQPAVLHRRLLQLTTLEHRASRRLEQTWAATSNLQTATAASVLALILLRLLSLQRILRLYNNNVFTSHFLAAEFGRKMNKRVCVSMYVAQGRSFVQQDFIIVLRQTNSSKFVITAFVRASAVQLLLSDHNIQFTSLLIPFASLRDAAIST